MAQFFERMPSTLQGTDSFLHIVSAKQGDVRLSGPHQALASKAGLTYNKRVPIDLMADSPSTVPPSPRVQYREIIRTLRLDGLP
ncbi:hypothetical protein PoB_006291900 [Plakobranchus ocellatus]|uniref:Uncharacterized protein n=1 Tax=Plakobranchus ocellatus TaxID=259542 RepID=A0AAV4CX02_9GAST|nr:hypothetical protein PoB_006291900 [Plakobranchus ocellatus]